MYWVSIISMVCLSGLFTLPCRNWGTVLGEHHQLWLNIASKIVGIHIQLIERLSKARVSDLVLASITRGYEHGVIKHDFACWCYGSKFLFFIRRCAAIFIVTDSFTGGICTTIRLVQKTFSKDKLPIRHSLKSSLYVGSSLEVIAFRALSTYMYKQASVDSAKWVV